MSPWTRKRRKANAKATSRSIHAGWQLPVGRIRRLLRRNNYAERVGAEAPVYLHAVVEYLAAEFTKQKATQVFYFFWTMYYPERHNFRIAAINLEEFRVIGSSSTIQWNKCHSYIC